MINKNKVSVFKYLSLCFVFLTVLFLFIETSYANNEENTNIKETIVDEMSNSFTNIINENNVGKVWTDKSVFSSDINLDGTNIKKNEDEDFLVSLSAASLGIDLNIKEGNVKDIAIVLDASGSMDDHYVTSGSEKIWRITACQRSIKEFLSIIAKANSSLSMEDEKFHVSFIRFSGVNAAKVIFDLQEINSSNLTTLQTLVDGVTTSSGTYCSKGLNLALEQITEKGRENVDSSIITFLDGVPSGTDGNTSIALAKKIKNNHNISMFSIVMNEDAKGGLETSMDKVGQGISSNYNNATSTSSLGDKTGDSYYFIPQTAEDLTNAFKDIIKTIQRKGYVLENGSNLTFTDKLGSYMEVNKIKVLSYNGTVYTYVSESIKGNVKKYTFSNAVNDVFNKASSLSKIVIEVTKSSDKEVGDIIKVEIPSNLVPISMYNVTSKFLTDKTVYTTTLQEKKPVTLVYSSNIKKDIYDLYRNYDTKLIDYIKKNGKIEDNIARVKFFSNYYQSGSNGTTEVDYKPYSMNNKYFYEDESYLYIKNGSNYVKYNGDTLGNNTYYVKYRIYKVGTDKDVIEEYIAINSLTNVKKDIYNYWYLSGVNKRTIGSDTLKDNNETYTAVNLISTTWNDLEVKSYLGNNGIKRIDMDVDRISVTVEKRWDDEDNDNGKRPKSVKVRLKGNDEFLVGKEVELNEENDWSYTFLNLPTKVDGKAIKYTVFEEEVDNYKASIVGSEEKGYLITNTYVPDPYVPKEEENPVTGFMGSIIVIVLSIILIYICYYFRDKRNRLYKI